VGAEPPRGRTDWPRLDAMSDAEAEAAAASDPDAQPLTAAQLAAARRVTDVAAVRRGLGMSQAAFAAAFGIPLGTIRDWEQGRSVPDAPARSYLRVIAADPQGTRRALAG